MTTFFPLNSSNFRNFNNQCNTDDANQCTTYIALPSSGSGSDSSELMDDDDGFSCHKYCSGFQASCSKSAVPHGDGAEQCNVKHDADCHKWFEQNGICVCQKENLEPTPSST